MGNACSKRPVTLEHRDEAYEPVSLFKYLQQDLQSARYTNVHSLGEDILVHGCTVRYRVNTLPKMLKAESFFFFLSLDRSHAR